MERMWVVVDCAPSCAVLRIAGARPTIGDHMFRFDSIRVVGIENTDL